MRDRTKVRRFALLAALASAAITIGVGAGSASAAPCQPIVTADHPTGYTDPNGNVLLTAAYVNTTPPSDTDVDATGCDVGVFYDTGSHTLTDDNVFSSTYYGVLSVGSGAVTNITHSSVYDVGNHPHDGVQRGIDVAYRDGSSGQLDHSQIFDYQKGGVLVAGGSNATVLSNVIRGLGPVTFIAQNGVQYSSGATGTVNNNYISDYQYTGCPKQNNGTCTYVVSTGILLFGVDPKQVDTKNNTYRNNDVNLLNASNSAMRTCGANGLAVAQSVAAAGSLSCSPAYRGLPVH